MTEFVHRNERQEPYHYLDCGLSNVWLFDGVEHHDTPYGPATSIRDIDQLHQTIGISIARSAIMTGEEFRFLRTELDLSQRALASLLKTTEQNIHRWETGKIKDIPGPAQVALAGYYLECQDNDSSLRELMDHIAKLDAAISNLHQRYFASVDDRWEIRDAA